MAWPRGSTRGIRSRETDTFNDKQSQIAERKTGDFNRGGIRGCQGAARRRGGCMRAARTRQRVWILHPARPDPAPPPPPPPPPPYKVDTSRPSRRTNWTRLHPRSTRAAYAHRHTRPQPARGRQRPSQPDRHTPSPPTSHPPPPRNPALTRPAAPWQPARAQPAQFFPEAGRSRRGTEPFTGAKYACLSASVGVMRARWSYRRHLSRKSSASGETRCWLSRVTNLPAPLAGYSRARRARGPPAFGGVCWVCWVVAGRRTHVCQLFWLWRPRIPS